MCAKRVQRAGKQDKSARPAAEGSPLGSPTPKDAPEFHQRAIEKWATRDRKGALADLEAAARLAPADVWILYDLGNAVMAMGNNRRAIEYFSRVLDVEPTHADALILRGICADLLGVYSNALRDLSDVIALRPDDADAWNSRGIVLRHQGRLRKAMLNYNRSIELNPATAKFYFNRALLHEELGDLNRARSDLEKSKELDPEHEGTKRALKRVTGTMCQLILPIRRRRTRDSGGRLRGRQH